MTEFFGTKLGREIASERGPADLVLGNNVLAQVPDINDFAGGVAELLGPGVKLIEHLEYDTIYHEHFSYFSLHSIRAIFGAQGLDVVDVEELPSHGGSLRVYLQHAAAGVTPAATVIELLAREDAHGMREPATYRRFAEGVRESKRALLELLTDLRRRGKHVVGYGAPGKGNTLLNYCGIRTDFLDYTVDRNPYKQGKHTPGTHIPIHAPEMIAETKPDVIVILPWNLAREISGQLAYTAKWGATLVVPIPTARVLGAGAEA
jgi:hypothetical protein